MITTNSSFNRAHVLKATNPNLSVHDVARIEAAEAKRARRAARKEADRLRNAPVVAVKKPAAKKRVTKKVAVAA